MRTVDNTQDILDSRSIIARIEELENDRESAGEDAYKAIFTDDRIGDNPDDLETEAEHARIGAEAEWNTTDDGQELAALKSLADEAEGYSEDWKYGATLIRDSYFETYAQEIADDIGAIDSNAKWPLSCIDWKQAAEELQQDYASVDFDDVTYWVR